jgi:hypothetical protein
MNQILKFSSKIFEEIVVEGIINLKAERKFKHLKAFDLKILNKNEHLLDISAMNDFLKLKYSIPYNQTAIRIQIENNNKIFFDDDKYELKLESMYPFRKKYGEVLLNNQKIGDIILEKKFIDMVLNFRTCDDILINEINAFKIAVLILLNIADLDGSE